MNASFRIIDANGNRLKPEAIVPLYVKMGKTMMRSLFVVVKGLSVACILGCTFLRRQVKAIFPGEESLLLHSGQLIPFATKASTPAPKQWPFSKKSPTEIRLKRTHPNRETHFLRVAARRTLSPGEQAAVWITCPAMGLCYLNPRRLSNAYAGVQLANGVADIVPHVKFKAYVTNFSAHVRTLPKGMILGTAAPHPTSVAASTGNSRDTEVFFASVPWEHDSFCTAPACAQQPTSCHGKPSCCSSCRVLQDFCSRSWQSKSRPTPEASGDECLTLEGGIRVPTNASLIAFLWSRLNRKQPLRGKTS